MPVHLLSFSFCRSGVLSNETLIKKDVIAKIGLIVVIFYVFLFYDLILFMAEINFVTSGIVFRSFWIKIYITIQVMNILWKVYWAFNWGLTGGAYSVHRYCYSRGEGGRHFIISFFWGVITRERRRLHNSLMPGVPELIRVLRYCFSPATS